MKKNGWLRIKLGFNAICLTGAAIYYVLPRKPIEDTFVIDPLRMILAEPLLSYGLFFFLGFALFRYCLEHIGNERLRRIGKITSIIVAVYFLWMAVTSVICLSGIFNENELIFGFFRISYPYMKSELNRHVLAALAVADALNIVNKSQFFN